MRSFAALLAAAGAASANCPAPAAVATVSFGGSQASALHFADGAPWNWIPQDNVMLKPPSNEADTLTCGNYYGYPCRRTENGTQISVYCQTEVCDVYAFLYHEPPRSMWTNGRLPLTLPANDWQSGSCAPEFCIPAATSAPSRLTFAPMPPTTASPTRKVVSSGPGGNPDDELPDARKAGALDAQVECCRMTAFRKQVEGDKQVQFTVDEAFGTMDAYYLVLAVAPGVDCSSNSRQTQEACEAKPANANAQCRWVPSGPPKGEPVTRSRAAEALSGIPTSSPTASPVGGRCVDDWCPRLRGPPQAQRPTCNAPLTEPQCVGGPSPSA